MDQLKVRIKQCISKVKILPTYDKTPNQRCHESETFIESLLVAKEDFMLLFLDVEHVIQDIYGYFISMNSIDEAMKTLPESGQLLSELSRVPMMQVRPQLFTAWVKCVFWFYKMNAESPVEVKARDWALKLVHSTVSTQMKADDPVLRKLGMVPSVLLKNQLSHNVSQITKLLELRNGHQWDWCTDCEHVNMLKCLSSVLLVVHQDEQFQSLWCTLLQQLSQCPLDGDIVKTYHRLTLSQQGAYRGECKVNLPYSALVVLWSSHLPALEQELLEMVHAISTSPSLPSIMKKIIQSRSLAEACSESCQIAHAVREMLNSLLVKTGGMGVMSDIITQFYQCVRDSRKQNNVKHEVCASHISFYSPELQPLVRVLTYPVHNLGAELIGHHLRQISDVIPHVLISISATSHMKNSLKMLTLEFRHWIYTAMWNMLQCDRKNVDSCLDIIYLSHIVNPDVKVVKACVREMVQCLRGLVGKTNLKLADIEYSVSSCMKPDQDNSIARQILVVFLLQSVSGLHLAEDILRQAIGNSNPEDHLCVLLYAHQVFDIDLGSWSPYKISQYAQLLKTLRETLSSQSKRKEESETESSQHRQEILAELERLLCTPALNR